MSISYSKKLSMVTIHENVSPTIFIKLDDANYLIWSQILEMHVASIKNKAYSIGRKVATIENDPN